MNLTHFINSLWAIICEMSPYILLGFLIAGLLHEFVRPQTMSRHLSGSGWRPVVKAALLGIPLPLCSCGVLPTAVSLRRRGASRGASTSFLIATPQTGVDSIAATYSLLGLPFAIIRPIAALAGAVGGGMAVSRWGEKDEEKSLAADETAFDTDEPTSGGIFRRLIAAVRYGLVDMVASVGKWLVIGLFVAALITVFVPDSLFVSLNRYPLLAMLAVVAVAVPMYVCATGSIPIALSLMLKGLSPGIAFVLLMAGPAANFASVMILSKTQGTRATIIYVASVVVTAILFGLMIDYFLPASWFVPSGAVGGVTDACHFHASMFTMLCSILLAGLLIFSLIRSRFSNKHQHLHLSDMNTREYKINGMACAHCKATVEKAISALEGTKNVSVDLSKGTATVEGEVSPEAVAEAVTRAGFEMA
ncbi:MAG: permease [Paramuribaculum sp.]|nr:permease [Paramuribaculum sp.]